MRIVRQHSAHVAALCYVLGRETPGIDPEQALLAGLVHDIGAVAIIGGVNQFSVLAQREEVLNYTIDSLRIEVGVLTLNQWRLQDEFEDVVKNAENWFRIGSAIPENSDVVILAQLRIGLVQMRRFILFKHHFNEEVKGPAVRSGNEPLDRLRGPGRIHVRPGLGRGAAGRSRPRRHRSLAGAAGRLPSWCPGGRCSPSGTASSWGPGSSRGAGTR